MRCRNRGKPPASRRQPSDCALSRAASTVVCILEGAKIYGPGNEKVGSVSHIHGGGPTSQVVVDVRSFLGIGAKSVAVALDQLEFLRDEDGNVHAVTNWTKDRLKEIPEHI